MDVFSCKTCAIFKGCVVLCWSLVAINSYAVSIASDELSSMNPHGWQGLMNKALFTESISTTAPIVSPSNTSLATLPKNYGGLDYLQGEGGSAPTKPAVSVYFLLLLSGVFVWLFMRTKRLNTK